ncbi:hypothetical protein ACYSNU_17630 [Enterococcus sp. LJL120]
MIKERKTYQPLDDLLDESGLKKKIIAERLGIDYSTFYNWRIKPSVISAVELGELSDITRIDFMRFYKVVKKFSSEHDKLSSSA